MQDKFMDECEMDISISLVISLVSTCQIQNLSENIIKIFANFNETRRLLMDFF